MKELTEQERELITLLVIATDTPKSILDMVTEINNYFNTGLNFNDKYIQPLTHVMYDGQDSIIIYKFVPQEPIPCYEQAYNINLRLQRITCDMFKGDSFYDIRRRIAVDFDTISDLAINMASYTWQIHAYDEARYQANEYAIEHGELDANRFDCPDEAIEKYCKKYDLQFDLCGNILNN